MPGTRFTDVRRFESIDSTNRYLLDEARAGAPEGVVAVADHQTAGRGRLGRRWEAPPGANLLLSVLLRPELACRRPPSGQRGGGPGRGGRHRCGRAGGRATVGIKWPNDLVGRGRPEAGRGPGRGRSGRLVDDGVGRGAPPVVVGIGHQCQLAGRRRRSARRAAGSATSLLAAAGRPVDRDALLEALLDALGPRVDDLGSAAGRARLAARPPGPLHHARDPGPGRPGRRPFEGTATAVDARGPPASSTWATGRVAGRRRPPAARGPRAHRQAEPAGVPGRTEPGDGLARRRLCDYS